MRPALNVNPGDVVIFDFDQIRTSGEKFVQAKVAERIYRYERYNGGQTKAGDLLTYFYKGELCRADASLVSEIIHRAAPRVLPVNIYREFEFGRLPARGTATGSPRTLVAMAIGELDVKATTPIHELVDYQICNSSCGITVVGSMYLEITVNVKAFRKWIKKNWSRLLKTTKSVDHENTEMNMEWEEDYKKDCERDFGEDEYDAK